MTRDESRGLLLILLILLMLLIVIGNDGVKEEPRELQWIHCAVPDQEKCPLCRCQAIQDSTRKKNFPVP